MVRKTTIRPIPRSVATPVLGPGSETIKATALARSCSAWVSLETLPGSAHGHRHDFVLHAHGDPQKKIHLAFLPFALGLVSKRKKTS